MKEVSARVAMLSAASLFVTACSSPPLSNVQATVQVEVRATVTAATNASRTSTPTAASSSVPVGRPTSAVPGGAAANISTASSGQLARSLRPVEASTPVDASVARQIDGILVGLPGAHTAVVQSLVRPVRVEVQAEAEVPSASTIKLPLMIAIYQQMAAGKLLATQQFAVRKDQVVGGTGILQGQVGRTLTTTQLLETTLTYSDNTGANMLVDAIGGMNVVNATMAELGFDHTRMRRLLMDVQAQERGLENTTSAADLADMLARIQRGDMISRDASSEMLRILELRGRQTDPSLDFLGRDLVPRPAIAHLNGTLGNVRNDAGIVELQDQPFIFVSLLQAQPNPALAEDAIARAAVDVARALRSTASTV